jgi:hypothetical protein
MLAEWTTKGYGTSANTPVARIEPDSIIESGMVAGIVGGGRSSVVASGFLDTDRWPYDQ